VDQKGTQMSKAPILQAVGVTKNYGRVVALDGSDLELFPGEVLAVVGDNGAGKSTLIKCLSGAEIPDEGQIILDGHNVSFKRPQDGRHAGIETVYQTLAVAPALDIASNLYLGREIRKKGPLGSVLRMLDNSGMRKAAKDHISALGIGTIQNISQAVETLSGGQRQAVAVARAAAFGLKLIESLRDRGMPVILISHNMPQVFEVADRIQIQRLGKRAAVVTPKTHSMNDVVAIMTGAMTVDKKDQALTSVR
jgi:fructose transport system ATP-binding protein